MNSEKQKVLAIFPQLPLPQFAGDRQKVHNHIKILSKNYQLNAVIICRTKPTSDDLTFLEQHSASFKIFYLSKLTILLNLFKGVLRGEALQVAFFYNTTIQGYINAEVKKNDFVFCNLIRVAKYAEYLDIPKYIDIVDSLSINYKRSLENVQSILWKFIYKYEYKHLYDYELLVMQKFNASFLVNYSEQQFWQKQVPDKPIVWLPQGIKEELFNYTQRDASFKNSIMFIGKMDYQPNIDAVIWFLKHVWDKVDKQVVFYIAGVNPPQSLIQMAKDDKRVKFMGYMKDPYLIMNSCNLVISPMQTGGGVQNKILEGMALGKINIATTLGAESIRFAENGKHLLVIDNPSEMASAINQILKNPQQYELMEGLAKELVTKVYTWSNFENELLSTIQHSTS
ncbi:MAG: glycosyltransferase [Chitinophagaceae bacterium]|jgi:glycosyltransferase involved in cell wall biosynthesis|nr:glycosyltransferase [Chitinophagaceae bacterium]